jgi:hypothetical protein
MYNSSRLLGLFGGGVGGRCKPAFFGENEHCWCLAAFALRVLLLRLGSENKMLGLFTGQNAAAAVAPPQQRKARKNQVAGGSAAPTIAASDVLTSVNGGAPTRSVHAFNAPEAEAILGLRQLLVKIVGAKDLPESAGSRRSCSAEVQLVSELGAPLGDGALHDRTGPPNHFTTVKDTAPVWNAEFVADLPADLSTAGLALRLAVWDDAASPPTPLGECLIHANELQAVCMREEERTLPLEAPSPPSAAAIAHSISLGNGARPNPSFASGALVPTASSGGQPSLKVRLAYVDVRAAMGLLADAASLHAQVAHERALSAAGADARETQLQILSAAMREEEARAAGSH